MTSYETGRTHTHTGAETTMGTKGTTGMAGSTAYGKVILTLKSAHNLRDKAWIGKADPYCTVEVANASISTHVVKNAGDHADWGESFAFNNVSPDDLITFKVHDKNLLKDSLMGEGSLSMRQVFESNQMDTRVPLTTRTGTKEAGEIWVSMRMEGGMGGAEMGTTKGAGYTTGRTEREYEREREYEAPTTGAGYGTTGGTTTTGEGGVCHQEYFTKTEDRPVVKERITVIREHRPVEKQYVVEQRFVGEKPMTGTTESLGITQRVVEEAAPRAPCE